MPERYRVGLILRDRMGNFDEAIEVFRKAKDEAPRSEVARSAGDAIRDVEELQAVLATVERWQTELTAPPAAVDTAAVVVDTMAVVADTTVVVVDTMTVVTDTTALDTDAIVAVGDTTALDTDAIVAVGDTTALDTDAIVAVGDTTMAGAEAAFVTTLTDTLSIPLEDLAPSEPDTIVIPDEARAMFRAGELYLFKMGDADRALEYYAMVIDNFGETPLGPKAAFAVAWTHDRILGQPMLAAQAYQAVLDRYPGTDYALEASSALGVISTGPRRTDEEPTDGTDEGELP
ncbi:tetratricopeptide repeat protein [bacterium]|nr:tetratricopeptide repeat protein [bacterium]